MSVEPATVAAGLPAVLVRRAVLAGSYALLTVILLGTVANDVEGVRLALDGLGDVLPDDLPLFAPDPFAVALVAVGLVAFFLAAGTYLVSRDTGAAFGLLAASTVGWFLFPYSQVPWITVFTGARLLEVEAPVTVWLLGGLIVAVGTVEMVASARDGLVRALARRHLPDEMVRTARAASLESAAWLVGGSLALGALVAVLYGLLREDLSRGILRDPSLVWAPALLGLAAALGIWLASRAGK